MAGLRNLNLDYFHNDRCFEKRHSFILRVLFSDRFLCGQWHCCVVRPSSGAGVFTNLHANRVLYADVYFGSAIPFALAAVAVGFFQENYREHKGFTFTNHFEQIKAGVKISISNKFILWSTGILALVFAISYTFSNTYQPYLVGIGFPVAQFSYILPVMFVVQAVGGWSFGKLLRFFERKLFWFAMLGIALSVSALGFFPMKTALALIFVFMFMEGVARPLVSNYANRYIDSANRATVISVQSMIGSMTAAAMLFLIGFLTDRIGVYSVLIALGAFVLMAGVVLLIFRPKNVQA